MKLKKWLKAIIALTVGLLALSGADLYEALRADQTLTWPTTIATIRAHGVRLPLPWYAHWYSWNHATVTYDYQVNGQSHTCDRVRYQQPADGRFHSQAEAAAKSNYPLGITAEIHYDSTNPSRAVLLAAPADWPQLYRPWLILSAAALALHLLTRTARLLEIQTEP